MEPRLAWLKSADGLTTEQHFLYDQDKSQIAQRGHFPRLYVSRKDVFDEESFNS